MMLKNLKILAGVITIGITITGCSHLGKKITQESINDPYALYNGIKAPYDLKQALTLAKKQCEEDNLQSCFLYAYLLDKGEGVKQDKQEAYKIFEKSCNGYEKTITTNENGSVASRQMLIQDANSCYFVAKKLFDEKSFIEAYKKNEVFLNKGNKVKIIAIDKTNSNEWNYEKMVLQSIPFDEIMSYKEPLKPINEDSIPIYEEGKKSVILFSNIEKIKAYAPNVLAYYDFRIEEANKSRNIKEAFLFKRNKAILLEALKKPKEAEKIYRENCELSDSYSCIYYKNIITRGGNL